MREVIKEMLNNAGEVLIRTASGEEYAIHKIDLTRGKIELHHDFVTIELVKEGKVINVYYNHIEHLGYHLAHRE